MYLFAKHFTFCCFEDERKTHNVGTNSMQNTSEYEEPRSSDKRLHENSFDPRSDH